MAAERVSRIGGALAVVAVAAVLNVLAWVLANPPVPLPDAPPPLGGLAYNAAGRHDSPLARRLPPVASVDADLRQWRTLTARLRTYSAAEQPALPALADQHGIELALGVWLDGRRTQDEAEVAAAISAARRHRSVTRVIVGNETLLRGALTAEQLVARLQEVRRAVSVPLSTAEPWHVWLRHPELAQHVDFITVHLLPYWEGVPVHAAVDDVFARWQQLRDRFPGKAIVIGEVGWPSEGLRIRSPRGLPQRSATPAEASPLAQARFVREFVQRAHAAGLDYYLMEAADQPWKRAVEGAAGAHWGVHDATRAPKFAWTGPVHADPHWPRKAALSTALGAAVLLPLLLGFRNLSRRGRAVLAGVGFGIASLAVAMALWPMDAYLDAVDWVLFALLLPALALLVAIVVVQAVEFAEMHWPDRLRHRAGPRPWPADEPPPFVSLHLACCNEPPLQVIAALDSLAALDWPAFEVIVVDNNTADPALWQPVRDHALALAARLDAAGGPRVRFLHLPRWPGHKAGALNEALRIADPRAAWIGVVDADYVVERDWLRRVAGWWREPGVAAVQSPQAHRAGSGHRLDRLMHWEYEGFFRIGMHHRHERNAVIQHGTLTLVDAQALRAAGGWSAACVCEDTELGLRLLHGGQRVVYVDEHTGSGLLPSDFAAYARQRQRWAQGAMQILRLHARALFLGGPGRLGLAQRYHFVAGWLPWIGDAMHLVFSLAAVGWTLVILASPTQVPPPPLFVVPLLAMVAVRWVMTPLLYRRLVACSARDRLGAAWAGMALSHAVARGVLAGLFEREAVFHVTRKGGSARAPAAGGRIVAAWRQVREEVALLAGLLVAALAVAWHGVLDATASSTAGGHGAWIGLLLLQALPYVAATTCAWASTQTARPARPATTGQRLADAKPAP